MKETTECTERKKILCVLDEVDIPLYPAQLVLIYGFSEDEQVVAARHRLLQAGTWYPARIHEHPSRPFRPYHYRYCRQKHSSTCNTDRRRRKWRSYDE